MPVQAGYVNLFTKQDISKNDLLSDNNLLSYNLGTTTANYLPPLIEKNYTNFYEFILTNGEKKILILEDIINENHINTITSNNKTLLQGVYISNNCISIDVNTFKDCTNLELVSYINNNNSLLENINSGAFQNCSKLSNFLLFDFSSNLQNIGNNAFKDCINLYEINLHKCNSLQTLGSYVFDNCSKILTVILSSSITFGDFCFANSGLVNIFFSDSLSNNIGNNIFDNIPENACCYYKSGNINGTEFTRLNNIFPNNGNNVVFIENTTLSSLSNNNITNTSNFYNINYDTNNNTLVTIVNNTKNIIDSIIKKRNSSIIYNINLAFDSTLSGTGTAGNANWSTGQINLNPDNTGNLNFNGVSTNINVIVLFHEVMHIFGYGSGSEWEANSNINTSPSIPNDYYFDGKNATYQYNNYLKLYNYSKKLYHVKIEDSGGSGTAGAHIEESFRYYNVGGTVIWAPQVRYDENENIYPNFYEEIMSGWLDSNNYFTIISAGVLQDLGFSINYNSEYIYNNTNLNSYPDVEILTPKSTFFQNPSKTNDEIVNMLSNIKCKCCHNDNVFEFTPLDI